VNSNDARFAFLQQTVVQYPQFSDYIPKNNCERDLQKKMKMVAMGRSNEITDFGTVYTVV